MEAFNSTNLPQDSRVNLEIYEFLPLKEREYQLRHIDDSKVNMILTSHCICLFIAYVAVALRFLSRRFNRAAYKADDWMILVSLLSFSGYVATVLLSTIKFGAARHAILLKHPTLVAICIMAAECLYNPSIGFIKFSTLALYGRIFTFPGIRRVLWGIGILIASYSIANIFSTVFQCRPIAAAWNPLLRLNAKCIDVPLLFQVVSAFNVFSDLAILAVPLPHLWKLQMPRSTKMQLIGLFCMGGFVTIVSTYRIPVLSRISLNDGAYDTAEPTLWSVIEISVATFCACGITYRPLIQALFGVRRSRRDDGASSPTPPELRAANVAGKRGRGARQSTDGTFTGLRSFIVGKWSTSPCPQEKDSTQDSALDSMLDSTLDSLHRKELGDDKPTNVQVRIAEVPDEVQDLEAARSTSMS